MPGKIIFLEFLCSLEISESRLKDDQGNFTPVVNDAVSLFYKPTNELPQKMIAFSKGNLVKKKDSICRLPLNIFDVYEPDKRQQQSTKLKKKKTKTKRRSAVCIRGFEFTRLEEDVAAEKNENYINRKNNISLMKGLHEYLSSLFPHPDLTPLPTPALLSPLPFSYFIYGHLPGRQG